MTLLHNVVGLRIDVPKKEKSRRYCVQRNRDEKGQKVLIMSLALIITRLTTKEIHVEPGVWQRH